MRKLARIKILRPLRIFLAEDNPADVYLVEMALNKGDVSYVLRRVSDGQEALDCVARFGEEEFVPDLALLDLNLPRKGGESVIQSIRGRPCCQATKIIVMSSSVRQCDRATAAEFRALYFPKPSDLTRFLELGELVKSLFETAS